LNEDAEAASGAARFCLDKNEDSAQFVHRNFIYSVFQKEDCGAAFRERPV
jgi:hypothetical protein